MGRSDQACRGFCNVGRELKSKCTLIPCRDSRPGVRLRAGNGPRQRIILPSCAAVCSDGPNPGGPRGDEWRRGGRRGAPRDYAIQDHDGTRFSQGRFARKGNRRRNAKVSSSSGLRKREVPLFARPRARALVENAVHGRKIRGPRDLQEDCVGSSAQDRTPRRYRRAGHVARLRSAARAPAGNHSSQLSQRVACRRMGERPARAGRSPSAVGTVHASGPGAAPEPAPQVPDGRLDRL